ncbi:putative replication factor C subunit 2 [Besnoitia besnoiti]|uniref:Putative replication factor C subunit 2 n=1 Tax=Besnoitia besnoiti TaxID=94643 RepID=A0A2A9MGZ2_BESBE|nr:putative replication factor C subunit 2 [Besnoitia besnoiti]PFH37169.1 putative replication factor C subunit 2 [Besnoitia besnoiti]
MSSPASASSSVGEASASSASSSARRASATQVPWVEKYRPRRVEDMAHQEEPKKMLRRILETGNMPHLLFYGPPGTGKTSAALALVRELFGREEAKNRLLELNASDDRGIKVVREKIKQYTKTNISKGKVNPETGREMPPWKVVILDEADMMTQDAQSALRRIMEAFSRTTRFIIICNYVHKIIDPIFSRCSPHRFEPVARPAQEVRVRHICESEGIRVTPQAVDALLRISQGDLRRAVTLLQSAASIYDEELSEEAILEVAGQPPARVITDLLRACAVSPDEASAEVENVISQGWDVCLILQEMIRQVVLSPQLKDLQKARVVNDIAQKEFAVFQGASPYLQLLSLSLRIHDCLAAA